MKLMKQAALFALFAIVHCEPPVPQNQYLPPSSPSNNYLPPSSSYGAPSASYSVPSQQQSYHQAPTNTGFGGSGPASSYGAPALTSAIFSKPQSSYGPPSSHQQSGGYSGGGNSGSSGYGYGGGQKEENYGPAKYEFEYNVQDYSTGQDFGHMESREGDKTVGRYYVLLPDGRKQIVNYEADEHGYRPTITYEQTNSGYQGGQGQGGFSGYDNNAQSKFNGY